MTAATDPHRDPEQAFDAVLTWVDGPLNRRAEKLLKNRLVLAWLGGSLTAWSHGLAFWQRLLPPPFGRAGGQR